VEGASTSKIVTVGPAQRRLGRVEAGAEQDDLVDTVSGGNAIDVVGVAHAQHDEGVKVRRLAIQNSDECTRYQRVNQRRL
jgi:hypothetical protein